MENKVLVETMSEGFQRVAILYFMGWGIKLVDLTKKMVTFLR